MGKSQVPTSDPNVFTLNEIFYTYSPNLKIILTGLAKNENSSRFHQKKFETNYFNLLSFI